MGFFFYNSWNKDRFQWCYSWIPLAASYTSLVRTNRSWSGIKASNLEGSFLVLSETSGVAMFPLSSKHMRDDMGTEKRFPNPQELIYHPLCDVLNQAHVHTKVCLIKSLLHACVPSRLLPMDLKMRESLGWINISIPLWLLVASRRGWIRWWAAGRERWPCKWSATRN